MAFDVEQAVREIPKVEEFPGLARAWRWSPMFRFVFSLAMNTEGTRIYQVNARDSFDEDLARAVLTFAREHRAGLGENPRPFEVVPGFSHPGCDFDAVVAIQPEIHGYYVGRNEELNEVVVGVFPAYVREFSGNETPEEAFFRFKRMLNAADMTREAAPFLRMRFDNTRTGGGSEGDLRGFTTPDVLLRELELLEGAPGSFVEYENRHGRVWRIEWNGSWTVDGEAREHAPAPAEVLETLN
ncbi:hypothetical protein [Streptomyces sp. NPDC058548]|uniref:hypothetical protein n=1 Tax=unclassified Streptomyces TaxID=2593676 RepID=UPI0036502A63